MFDQGFNSETFLESCINDRKFNCLQITLIYIVISVNDLKIMLRS